MSGDLIGEIGSGDRRRALEAVRDKLALAMTMAEPSVMAQLAGQLRQVLKDLDDLPRAEKVSKADELAAKRANRFAAPNEAASSGP